MSLESASAYIDLVHKFIDTCSAAIPAISWLLRAIGLMKKKEATSTASAVPEVLPVLGFGCLGGTIGLCITILFIMGAVVFIGYEYMRLQLTGWEGFGLPPIQLTEKDAIVAGSGLVTTLLAFGFHNKGRALGFLTGVLFGTMFGLMFFLMLALGH